MVTPRINHSRRNRWSAALATVACLLGLVGCRREPSVEVVEYEPNWVYAYQIGEMSEQPMDQALAETTAALTDLFGTADEPKLPSFILEDEDLASLISMDHVLAASGPMGEEGRGLYRTHCATCHGVTGNGRGPTAALVDPYPRDYRLGRFKFKSTPIGTKPTKADIATLIKHGIAGSSMVPIAGLSDADIEALTDYVIFLSWRGEVERSLLSEARELYFADGDSLYRPELKDSENAEDVELFEEQWELIQDFTIEVAENWLDAEDRVRDLPERDPAIVPDTFEEVLLAAQSAEASPVKESIERGRELFVSEKASCSKCHGKLGRGDGQTNDYDEWTKDWTRGLKPEDVESHIPLIARGALPVRKVSPRNFEQGVFRGGKAPEDLYRRIALGIEGTPMPAAAVGAEQIWDLVNFVRSLYVPQDGAAEDSTGASEVQEKISLNLQ